MQRLLSVVLNDTTINTFVRIPNRHAFSQSSRVIWKKKENISTFLVSKFSKNSFLHRPKDERSALLLWASSASSSPTIYCIYNFHDAKHSCAINQTGYQNKTGPVSGFTHLPPSNKSLSLKLRQRYMILFI